MTTGFEQPGDPSFEGGAAYDRYCEEQDAYRQDNERLRRLVQYCRMRLKRDAYREHVDKCLADLSLLDPDPEMQGKLIQSR